MEKQQLLPVLEIAAVDAARLTRLREENTQLQKKLDDLKTVDRAKALLAGQRAVSESEAYRQMQFCWPWKNAVPSPRLQGAL